MNTIKIVQDESARLDAFPVAKERVFLSHAGVAPLPRVAVDAMQEFLEHALYAAQENEWSWPLVQEARKTSAELLGCSWQEIALLGPTSVGLSLVANGIDWQPGDEVIYYRDDYPANVYPWTSLRDRKVKPVPLHPEHPGAITWDVIEAELTDKTRLVTLATCNFLSGFRVDIEGIGKKLHERDILFCVDGIQTLGAFPISVEHIDFLSADSHKWLLGPAAAGIFYVKASRFETLKPTLLGSWNVESPQFVAQDVINYEDTGRRYEPGMLNLPGIIGMEAAMRMLLNTGIDAIAERLLHLRNTLIELVQPLGFEPYVQIDDPALQSGIVTLSHPTRDMRELARLLEANNVTPSLRQNRIGEDLLRLSPHFYNTEDEFERVVELMK
jgi:selenocysteine lyase/cysteine desulfurase